MEEALLSRRKSFIEPGKIYFWTATIYKWYKLLFKDSDKKIILDSMIFLSMKGEWEVFAFVIMPNHIHMIIRINSSESKEKAHHSFLKYTAHEFRNLLNNFHPEKLSFFKVNKSNKEYQFWQRDSLAIHIYTQEVAIQKLEYIHNNPLADRWALAKDPSDYKYSSAAFYEKGDTSYGFLKNLLDEFYWFYTLIRETRTKAGENGYFQGFWFNLIYHS